MSLSRTLIALALLGTGLAARAEDPAPAAAVAVDVAAPAAIQAAAAITLPEVDPDTYFTGKAGGTFGKDATKILPMNKRVGVAGFRVVFVTDNSIKAQVRASYFGGVDRSGASAKMDVGLSGVDGKTLQAITDQAYATFLAQLAAAGREVVPAEEFQKFFAELQPTATSPEQPYRKEVTLGYGKQTGVAYSPTGIPLWFSNWDGLWSDKTFDQHNIKRFNEAAQRSGAMVVAPVIVVDFAQMSSSGNRSGFLAREASVGATLSMSVSAFSSSLTNALEVRGGYVSKGEDARVNLTQGIGSEIGFATMQEVKKEDNSATKGMFDALGGLMGMANAGGAARSKSTNQAVTNNEAYAEAARDALSRATGTFAAWFRKHPAS